MTDSQVRAIESLAETCQFGSGSRHAHKVATLASAIFDQLAARNLLQSLHISERRTLIAASYIHDIGTFRAIDEGPAVQSSAGHSSREPESQCLASFQTLKSILVDPPAALRREPLNAVDRSALLYAVLWHGQSQPHVVADEPIVDDFSTRVIAGILRVAEALDSPARPVVRDVLVRSTSNYIRFLVRTTHSPEGEIDLAQERSDMLSEALGQRIFVQEVIEA